MGKENSIGVLDRQVVAVDTVVAPKQVGAETTKAYGIVSMFNGTGGSVEGRVFQYDDGGCYDCHSCDECDPSPI